MGFREAEVASQVPHLTRRQIEDGSCLDLLSD